jgi:hypothetical protein
MRKSFCLPLVILSATACASQVEPPRSVSGTWFNCESGLIFATERSDAGMVVTVSDGRRFELASAPTAFGELFQSPSATLRIDDDFAVLAGGPVKDYTRCRQMIRDPGSMV